MSAPSRNEPHQTDEAADAARIDFSSPEFLANPYPFYDQMRSAAPILYRKDEAMWFLTAHKDVDALLRHRALGRSISHVASREELGWPPPSALRAEFDRILGGSLMDSEPPQHTRLKLTIHKAFTPRRVASMRRAIAGTAAKLLQSGLDRGRMELKGDFAAPLFRRWVLEEMEYEGHRFPFGTEIAFLLGAANRDPARFERPHRFDITREKNPHLSFGAGLHFCLGAPLARLELQIALETILQAAPQIHLADEKPEFGGGFVFRGLRSLMVEF